jgi:hypothetical protein
MGAVRRAVFHHLVPFPVNAFLVSATRRLYVVRASVVICLFSAARAPPVLVCVRVCMALSLFYRVKWDRERDRGKKNEREI